VYRGAIGRLAPVSGVRVQSADSPSRFTDWVRIPGAWAAKRANAWRTSVSARTR